MPMTKKGRKMKAAMTKTYGKAKGEQVYYAMENKKKGLARKRGKK